MAFFSVDESRFPIVVLTAREARGPTDEELEEIFTIGSAVFDRGEPYVLAYVPPPLWLMSTRQRRRYAGWLEAHRPKLARFNRGTALVLPNPLIRAVASAVIRLGRPPATIHVCGSLEEALRWCEARLRVMSLAS